MKRVVIILSVVAIIVALLLIGGKGRNPFGKTNSSISVPQDREIDMITMSGEGQTVTLRKEGERKWTINGTAEARLSAISFILQTLHTIEIKSPVTALYFNENITDKGISPVKVEAYASGRRITSFLVYRFSDDPSGNIVRKTAGSKPFIAHIPGYDLNPGSHFITDPKFWIPYNIFSLSPADIDTVTVSYANRVDDDLVIASGNRGYDIIIGGARPSLVDTAAIGRYLAYYTFVPFERWALELSITEIEDIVGNDPAYRITVTLSGGDKETLLLWKRYLLKDNIMVEDTDRLWGSTNGGADIFLVRYYDIDPLIKRADYFISD